jgi:coenzyme F420-reducing hydrogenase delta subunit
MTAESDGSANEAGSGTFNPKVIVFCCNWCSYAGADLAGVSRLQMPTDFRVIRVMCSGRVDPEHLLKAFSLGADGILVAGCHPADCHYIGGNYRTRRRIPLLKIMIAQFGLEPSRLQLEWISASEGEKFQQTITNFIGHIKELGPSPVKEMVV